MINIWISLFPKEDGEAIAVPLHELINDSLLWVVVREVLEPRALLEIILYRVCSFVYIINVSELKPRPDFKDVECLSHSLNLVVH